MTNEATRLARELRHYADAIEDEFSAKTLPRRRIGDAGDCAAPVMRQAAELLATLAQPAPTAEVALPAVSEADHPLHRCCDCPACTAYFADNPISNSDGAIYARSQTAAKDDAMASQEKPHD